MSEQIVLISGTWTLVPLNKGFFEIEISSSRALRYSYIENDTTGGIPSTGTIFVDQNIYIKFNGVAGETCDVIIYRR